MKSPLRLFAECVAVLGCMCVSSSAYAGDPAQAASSSTQPATAGPSSSPATTTVTIPGPLRSFLRMAGISQKALPEDVLPLLARNVYMQGYRDSKPTEFLILLQRYTYQAKELQTLAGSSGTIRVTGCSDAGPLVQILGYRMREGCGQKNVSLETADAERAFLTIDSGFPLTQLEESLQKAEPFTYAFPSSRVPGLFKESEWVPLSSGQKANIASLPDLLMNDPKVARLYWALAKNDNETRLALQRAPGLKQLLPYAAVLDFYGSQICIRSGRVIVPGEPSAQASWKGLVGASPESPGDFIIHLLLKDSGWLAAYFDVLSRLSQAQQAHLTEPSRLKRLYDAFRLPESEPPSTRGVFRKAPELLVLFTRAEWDSAGDIHVPGDLAVWKEILSQKTDSKLVHEWAKRSHNWDRPEQLLEALVAFSHMESDSGPLQIYLMMNEIDRRRSPEKRLSAGTVRLLAKNFSQLSSWYLVFTEFPDLSDSSIARFVTVADAIDKISNQPLRGNVLGSFQANIGLWQILARQGEIPAAQLDASWPKVIDPFAKISSSTQLFDAARQSLGDLLLLASGKANRSQDELIDLLAGPSQESLDGQRVHQEMANKLRATMSDQRLVSLDTLFALSDGLNDMAHGSPAGERVLLLASDLREFEMPRPIFTNSEKIDWAPAAYNRQHAELQARTDLSKVIKGPGTRAQLEAARGQLSSFLRDTLVGLNYAYYEPPGSQMLHHNPLFVRAHDFTGVTIMGSERLWRSPELFGVGTPAGGGAYLMGSLADLPYALASTEQDFISPENVQALIWKELVPELLVSGILPRWWTTSPNELHAVALYQRTGEELLAASVSNAQLRGKVISVLSDRMSPQRLALTEDALLHAQDGAALPPRVVPADTFYLAAQFRTKYPDEAASWGPAAKELDSLSRQYPAEVSWQHLSQDFGVPHPTMARNYARDLLNVKPFPFFGGYSSRLFGESWESSNLYWARLADEMGYSPVMLNSLVPRLTQHMTTKIFATELEDWPALLRAMQETGEDFRHGKIVLPPATNTTALRDSGR